MAAAKKLFLVDAMAHVYRAFFAPMVRMNAPSGMPTKVPFLFNNILRRLVKDYQPDYIGVVFDTSKPTFRDKLFEQYKAHRTPMPDELKQQLPYVKQLCEALRLPVKGNEPKAPALTLPDSLSPSTVPVKSRVSGMGLEILADQVRVLPSTLPFSSGPEPCAACWVPLSEEPSVLKSRLAFCAPRGELMTISHLPSTAMTCAPGDLAGI